MKASFHEKDKEGGSGGGGLIKAIETYLAKCKAVASHRTASHRIAFHIIIKQEND